MKNRGHKVKFRGGRDANRMLLRKLASNFIQYGKLETTKSKAKAIQPIIEKLVTKTKTNTQSDRVYVLRHVINENDVNILVKQITPQLKSVTSGFTRIVSVGQRITDGAEIAHLSWAYPVVLEKKQKVVVKKQSENIIKKEDEQEKKNKN